MIKVAVIEDVLAYRNLLTTMLATSNEIEIVYEAGNCLNIVEDLRSINPDVVIMDIDLPGKSGIEGVREIKQAFPDVKVLMLTVFEDEEKIFGAIKAGALGYLLKLDTAQVPPAVVDIYNGKSPMNSIIAKKVIEYFQKKQTVSSPQEFSLTRREHEILQLLMDGLMYKEIADKCFISVQTLNSHIKNIYHKLGVHSRAEISAKFRDSGI
jgi:DNA-binding NarL/FixJ family response regulator